jgi:hypothetical protein
MVKGARIFIRAVGQSQHALLEGVVTVDQPDYFQDGDFTGRSGQGNSPVGTAVGLHDFMPGQDLQYFGQEVE